MTARWRGDAADTSPAATRPQNSSPMYSCIMYDDDYVSYMSPMYSCMMMIMSHIWSLCIHVFMYSCMMMSISHVWCMMYYVLYIVYDVNLSPTHMMTWHMHMMMWHIHMMMWHIHMSPTHSCMMYDARYKICVMYYTSCMMCDVWCMMYDKRVVCTYLRAVTACITYRAL